MRELFLRVEKPVLWRHDETWRMVWGVQRRIIDREELFALHEKCRGKLPILVGVWSYDLGREQVGIMSRNPPSPPSQGGTEGLPSLEVIVADAYLEGGLDEESRLFATDLGAREKELQALSHSAVDTNWQQGIFQSSYPREVWEEAFIQMKKDIFHGEYYQANLTRQMKAQFSGNKRKYFLDLLEKNPAPEAAYFSGTGYELLSLSPELFLKFHNDLIITEPIKGTRAKYADTKQDEASLQKLLDSPKEKAELLMITDLLRNDLRQCCKSVSVEALRAVQENAYVWHTYSRIVGQRKEKMSILESLLTMLPGGSISGCPKKRAVEAIEALEPHRRNFFCGVFGSIQGNEARFSLLIRTLLHQQGKLTLQVGGGITAESQLEEEWEETEAKAKSFL